MCSFSWSGVQIFVKSQQRFWKLIHDDITTLGRCRISVFFALYYINIFIKSLLWLNEDLNTTPGKRAHVFRKYSRQANLNMYFFFCISGENACFFSLTMESNNLMKHSLNKKKYIFKLACLEYFRNTCALFPGVVFKSSLSHSKDFEN
jgi:hypothetical protein